MLAWGSFKRGLVRVGHRPLARARAAVFIDCVVGLGLRLGWPRLLAGPPAGQLVCLDELLSKLVGQPGCLGWVGLGLLGLVGLNLRHETGPGHEDYFLVGGGGWAGASLGGEGFGKGTSEDSLWKRDLSALGPLKAEANTFGWVDFFQVGAAQPCGRFPGPSHNGARF